MPEPTKIELAGIIVSAPPEATVILLVEIELHYSNVQRTGKPGESLRCSRAQAAWLVAEGVARWPGKPAEAAA